jgi:aryl-alcohol dehydrogenase-like predicted oxidoreductase
VEVGQHRVNRIGLGTNRLTDTAENRAFLLGAVDAGVNFIDTAHLYAGGESERAIGSALPSFHEEVVVATKGGYRGGGNDVLRAELEQSFERLGIETIPLYYLHRADPEVPLEETMGLLKGYRDDGRIAHIGLSEVTVDQIEHARSVVAIAAVQNEYNLAERKHDEVLEHCASEGIVFVPFFPLRGSSPAVGDVAARHDATPTQVKLAWLLHKAPVVAPIPGTLSPEHLKQNLAALDLELSREDVESLGG